MNRGSQDGIPGPVGEKGSSEGDEGDEMWLVVGFEMGKLTALERTGEGRRSEALERNFVSVHCAGFEATVV